MNFYTFAIVAVLAASAFALESSRDQEWEQWKLAFDKTYANRVEEQTRRGIWEASYDRVQEQNQKYELGLDTWFAGLNFFHDLTWGELNSTYLNGFIADEPVEEVEVESNPVGYTQIDWRQKGCVNPIKNQEQCGSCWSFSAASSLEGVWCAKKGELVSISEEQEVECVTASNGCNGGRYTDSFSYWLQNWASSENNYPYTSGNGNVGSCQGGHNNVAKTTGYVGCRGQSQMDSCIQTGPYSVAVFVNQAFFDYKGGYYNGATCGNSQANHAITVIGQMSNGHVIIRNSWGTGWGNAGYIEMGDCMCDLCKWGAQPTV